MRAEDSLSGADLPPALGPLATRAAPAGLTLRLAPRIPRGPRWGADSCRVWGGEGSLLVVTMMEEHCLLLSPNARNGPGSQDRRAAAQPKCQQCPLRGTA